ncbi:MAG: phosphate acyltransferase [Suipraeoptans sp.]
MNEFLNNMIERASKAPKRIAFPEPSNIDILKTAEKMVSSAIGTPVLIGACEEIEQLAKQHDVSTKGFEYFDNGLEENRIALASEYIAGHSDFKEKSVIRKSKDSVRCGLFLLKMNKVDGVAAGKEYSTGDVIFETISIVGMQEGVESVSSLGIAEIPGFEGSEGSLIGLADCAITAQPDSNDLAGIAIASADTAMSILGWEPRVAMLSFSTDGSSEHESIDVVREAINKVKLIRPDIKIDGEFQLDAAIIPTTASKKVNRKSEVAGKANILIFPNLHAGNIGVKMIQIFGHANAYGPVLQGFAQPVCDFSRSAPVDEMLGNVAMLVIRAGA